MKKHLLVSLFALSLFQIKAVDYKGLTAGLILVLSAGIMENSRANWNTERKTLKDKCFYYGKLVPASVIVTGVLFLSAMKSKSSNN